MLTLCHAELCLGFFEKPDFEPSQILVAEDVGYDNPFQFFSWAYIIQFFLQPTVYSVGSVVQAEFTPILRGYIVTGFKENEVLKVRIKSQVLFRKNLAHLKPVTDWKITYNPGTASYEIVEV